MFTWTPPQPNYFMPVNPQQNGYADQFMNFMFSNFMKDWEEKNKKKDEKKDTSPKMNWAQSILFLTFVMPIVGIAVSAFQFYIFGRIFLSLTH